MEPLVGIQRLVALRGARFTHKALDELYEDGLRPGDVVEAVLNARAVRKKLKSTSTRRSFAGEKLYVIESYNNSGTLIYTKGRIAHPPGKEAYYLFISAKRSRFGD